MIKFYYFESNAKDMSRPGFRIRGVHGPLQICQVYSDRTCKELLRWCRAHEVPKLMIHQHVGLLSHVDLWGSRFALGGPGVSKEAFIADVRYSDGRLYM